MTTCLSAPWAFPSRLIEAGSSQLMSLSTAPADARHGAGHGAEPGAAGRWVLRGWQQESGRGTAQRWGARAHAGSATFPWPQEEVLLSIPTASQCVRHVQPGCAPSVWA